MATDGDARQESPEDEMLPDERAVIAERIDRLDEDDAHLSVEAVADELGIDLE